MPKIETAIRDAIQRGARKQIRLVAAPLRREVRRLRQAVRQLRRDVTTLRGVAASWQRAVQGTPETPQVTEEAAKAARLSPRLILTLRRRLGLSRAKLARLVGVSAVSVAQWERGRSSPSGTNRRALVALRKLGRRDARGILARMPKPTGLRTLRPKVRGGRGARRRGKLQRPRR